MNRLLVFRRTGAMVIVAMAVAVFGPPQTGSASTADYLVAEVPYLSEFGDLGQAQYVEHFEVCGGPSFMDCTWADDLAFGPFVASDAGTTYWTDSGTPFFEDIVGRLTNGLDDGVVYREARSDSSGNPEGIAAGSTSESSFFGSQAGPNGIDLAGYGINRIGFRFDSVTLDTSTNVWSLTGAWLFAGTLDAKAACKDGGWRHLKRSDGTPFKNEGDCIQYFNGAK